MMSTTRKRGNSGSSCCVKLLIVAAAFVAVGEAAKATFVTVGSTFVGVPRDRRGRPDYCFFTKRHTMCGTEVRTYVGQSFKAAFPKKTKKERTSQ